MCIFLVVKLPINHDIELLRGFFQQLVEHSVIKILKWLIIYIAIVIW